jgi:hypothetical protein
MVAIQAWTVALVLRIDVDRPYGHRPLARHALSRLSSDFVFPKIEAFGYLRELSVILKLLAVRRARAYVFFRRCTLPSSAVLKLIDHGRHEMGLHLEDSRSFDTFCAEKAMLEGHLGRPISAVSKHGSGGRKYGRRHYAPYEPDKYIDWARHSEMKIFLGNLEDPSIGGQEDETGFRAYPSAFWLEPAWRDTKVFTINWLRGEAAKTDVVLLIHPENVLADFGLLANLITLLDTIETRIF